MLRNTRSAVKDLPYMDSGVVRRPCFLQDDDGLASLADMEAGLSGNIITGNNTGKQHYCHSTQICSTRGWFRTSCLGSPRSRSRPHFLEACFLCKKQLGNNRDIFMYGGDKAFCSEECRQEQVDMEESKEKNLSLSSSVKALRNKQQDQKTERQPTSTNRDYNSAFHTGAVSAA